MGCEQSEKTLNASQKFFQFAKVFEANNWRPLLTPKFWNDENYSNLLHFMKAEQIPVIFANSFRLRTNESGQKLQFKLNST